jgi:predicted RNase H-like nuclease
VLDATDHADACERSRRAIGVGVSIQAWNLVPKIRELDAVMTPDRQRRVRETHPELAFARLAGEPMADPKRSPAGRSARCAAVGLGVSDLPRLPGATPDDILDAIALVHSATAVLDGSATVLGDGERDERSLLMEIWG